MKLKAIFQFLFPRSICVEPATKFQAIQRLRFAKAGVCIQLFPLDQQESLLLDEKAEIIDTEPSKRGVFSSIWDFVSILPVNFSYIVPLSPTSS